MLAAMGKRSLRVRVDRMILGTGMSLAAGVLDRRIRKVLGKKAASAAAPEDQVRDQAKG